MISCKFVLFIFLKCANTTLVEQWTLYVSSLYIYITIRLFFPGASTTLTSLNKQNKKNCTHTQTHLIPKF